MFGINAGVTDRIESYMYNGNAMTMVFRTTFEIRKKGIASDKELRQVLLME